MTRHRLFALAAGIVLLLAVGGAPAVPWAQPLAAQEAPAAEAVHPGPDYVAECGGACHGDKVAEMTGGLHADLQCEQCHEGADLHLATPQDPNFYPRVHFDQEVCYGCHADQYDTFEIESRGKTYYGGSDGGPHPPKGWSKTSDLPYWNVLIDGHPFVLETYEDSPMAVNQIEHQETIRPGSEACMECHGTRAAFMMGIEYADKNGIVHSIPVTKTQVTLPNGTVVDIPAKEYTVKSHASNNPAGHTVYDGTSYKDPATGEWTEAVGVIDIPTGTKVWTYTDGVNLSSGDHPQLYEVKTVVTLPAPVVDWPVLDATGAQVGVVSFDTIASYPDAGADINGRIGFSPPAPADGNVATVARNWIYAAMEALAFDQLDYYFDDPMGETHFTGGGANWPSIVSGELCNQCHNPHSGTLRIVKKSLIAAIAARGINPYSPTGQNILTFEGASHQDQVVAVCAQCHSEYVGGYSANTKLDQDYFPWAKPADLEAQYSSLFGYLQDWSHGGPIVPWQSTESNARGFLPYGLRWPTGTPLVKVQHPEAEELMNSPMYNAGATCTDCHSVRITRPDGTKYTTHWFTSPLKLMAGFTGETETGVPVSFPPENPCAKCHTTDTIAQSQARIQNVQVNYFTIQERAQVALANALRYIKEQKDLGNDMSLQEQTYQRASMRWEYYSQAENSMGFHNNPEATTEVSNARIWVDGFVPWPLTPVTVRLASAGQDSLTLVFYDQATDEAGFIVERASALEGPYTQVAVIPTPNGANLGDVQWTETGLAPGTTYYYRVAAYGAGAPGDAAYGPSVWSVWATGKTQGVAVAAPSNLLATAVSSSQINLTWTDNSNNEAGFRLERALDAAFTTGVTVRGVGANQQAFGDTGLVPNTHYFYRIFAVGAGGSRSAASNTTGATTLDAPPAAPTNLVVTAVGQTTISLAWTDNSANEAGFYVLRKRGAGPWTRAATLGANTTTYTDAGLIRRTTYRYMVQAFNAIGTSAYSNVVTAKTQ
jgi:hypothetical protein